MGTNRWRLVPSLFVKNNLENETRINNYYFNNTELFYTKIRGEKMNTQLLDEMINYIENHLLEPVNYKKLSQIVGLPPYILQRVFQFSTNMTISDYVKKRKLSKAYENLLNGYDSITEIAFKYNYSSTSSFSRAFKKYFNCLPKEVHRKNMVEAFPKLMFNQNIINEKSFQYKIEKLDSLILYGKKIEINEEYYASQIYQFYNSLEKDGILKVLEENTWYGATIIEDEKEYYFVGSREFLPNLEKLEIQELKYLFIDDIPKEQNDIINAEVKLHNSYLPSTSYTQYPSIIYELEIYNNNNCTIAIPIN